MTDEIEYWLQIIQDNQRIISDADKMNEEIGELIEKVMVLCSLVNDNEHALQCLNDIMGNIKVLQKKLVSIIQRDGEMGDLISGRMKMLRQDLGLD